MVDPYVHGYTLGYQLLPEVMVIESIVITKFLIFKVLLLTFLAESLYSEFSYWQSIAIIWVVGSYISRWHGSTKCSLVEISWWSGDRVNLSPIGSSMLPQWRWCVGEAFMSEYFHIVKSFIYSERGMNNYTSLSNRCWSKCLGSKPSNKFGIVNGHIAITITNIYLSHLTQVRKNLMSRVKSYINACPKLEYAKHHLAGCWS